VARQAFREPRGLARMRALFGRWLSWTAAQPQGGCVILSAAGEFDDRPGVIRDHLAQQQRGWLQGLARLVGQAIEAGELPADTDEAQFAFELFGLILSSHHHVRLLSDVGFLQAAHAGLERLIGNPPRRPG